MDGVVPPPESGIDVLVPVAAVVRSSGPDKLLLGVNPFLLSSSSSRRPYSSFLPLPYELLFASQCQSPVALLLPRYLSLLRIRSFPRAQKALRIAFIVYENES